MASHSAASASVAAEPHFPQPPTVPTFAEAFAPLAHHLYPDGRPDNIQDGAGRLLLSDAWPVRSDRSPIPPDAARESIRSLRAVARVRGLDPPEIYSVAVAACATLPRAGRGAGSPLVDGTGRAFADIVRCLVTSRPVEGGDAADGGVDGGRGEDIDGVPAPAISMLLSASAETGRCDGRGRSAVLRFLTLAVRSGRLRRLRRRAVASVDGDAPAGARETLSSLYAVPFAILSDPLAVGDAVRLLHAITRRRHVMPHRARRVKALYDAAVSRRRGGAGTESAGGGAIGAGPFSPLLLLLQLYARYDPKGCGRFFPSATRLGAQYSRHFKVPDEAWEREFAGSSQAAVGNVSMKPAAALDAKTAPESKTEDSQLIGLKRRHPGVEVDEVSSPTFLIQASIPEQRRKRKRREVANRTEAPATSVGIGRSISATIDRLEDAFEGVHSSSWELLCRDDDTCSGRRWRNRSVRASDLLSDETLRHLILLSCAADGRNYGPALPHTMGMDDVCDSEVIRLRACLPHMLCEEWYDDAHNASDSESEDDTIDENDDFGIGQRQGGGKVRVVQALASLARHSDMLPPEAENFVVEEILPTWDGSDKIGFVLCTDLLAALKPTSFRNLDRRVLRHLGKLYVCGSPRIKSAIVSGALSSLVRRWGRLNWTSSNNGVPSKNISNENKRRVLQELIQWTDNLLLAGLIAEGGSDGGGHELIRLSALDLFNAVCEVCYECNFVASPSPALIYRLFLSSSAVGVDRVCALLLKYKGIFEKIKATSKSATDNAVTNGKDPVTEISGLERVALFNCFIFDFASVLWRCSPLPSLDEGQPDLARSNSILFTDIPHETLVALHHLPTDFRVAAALSITHGAVFSGFASDFLENYYRKRSDRGENAPPKLTPDLLTGTMKVKYLDHLKDLGFIGLHAFLTTFVGSLVEREKRKLRKKAEKTDRG